MRQPRARAGEGDSPTRRSRPTSAAGPQSSVVGSREGRRSGDRSAGRWGPDSRLLCRNRGMGSRAYVRPPRRLPSQGSSGAIPGLFLAPFFLVHLIGLRPSRKPELFLRLKKSLLGLVAGFVFSFFHQFGFLG